MILETSFFGIKVVFCRAYFANNIRICLRKNKSYVRIDSIFEAQNICFGSEIAGLLIIPIIGAVRFS